MSIESQAAFWYENVCEMPVEAMKSFIRDDNLLVGLNEFGLLMKRIYGDYKSYEVSTAERVQTKIGIMADDLDNYHYLTDMGLCLYNMAAVGETYSEGETACLRIDKALFKKNFKSPVTFYFPMLENYGFYFRYYKRDMEVSEFKKCDTFEVYYDNHNYLMPATKYLSNELPMAEVKTDYAYKTVLYMMADYESILLKKGIKRKEMDPLRAGICNTAGTSKNLWLEIVERMKQDYGLDTDIYVHTYVFPHWVVKFLKKKKTICTFMIFHNEIRIGLPLSYDVAKEVILKKAKLPQRIQECIQNFNCANCGKCENKSNLELFEGIPLCNLSYSNFITEESRCITMAIRSQEEASAIYDIVQSMVMIK